VAALGSIMPAPLVIFSTFVGFVGGRWVGAILMTLGMFVPAWSFTIIGHDFFEYLTTITILTEALDGISAGERICLSICL
jgi:chromate transporter